ncbi:hypothetical protein Tco_1235937 [Tanacetum coccineum]
MMRLVVVGGDGDVGVESDGGGDDDDGARLRWPMVEVVLWWDGDGGDEGRVSYSSSYELSVVESRELSPSPSTKF